MYVVYMVDMKNSMAVVYDTALENYTRMPLDYFMAWLDTKSDEVVVGVNANDSNICMLEIPAIGRDLQGNLVRYVSVLFSDYRKRFKFRDGVASIKFSSTEVVSFDLNVDSIENMVGIHFVINTLVGEPFIGLVVITYEDGVFRQYTHRDGVTRFEYEVPEGKCRMQFETEKFSILKGGKF